MQATTARGRPWNTVPRKKLCPDSPQFWFWGINLGVKVVSKDGRHKKQSPADPGEPMKGEGARTFEKVVLCHLDLVYRMAMKLTGDPHEAEDLVQETFLRAHSSCQI